jgi:hypothetical protein
VNGNVVYVNEPPVGVSDRIVTSADAPVTFDVLANDLDETDGLALFVSQHTQPAHGAVVRNSDGTLTYTPRAGFVGVDRFTYRVHDGAWESGDVAVDVEVELACVEAQSSKRGPPHGRARRPVPPSA